MTSSGTFTLWTMYKAHCPFFKNKQTNRKTRPTAFEYSHFLHYIKLKDVHTVKEHNTGSQKQNPKPGKQ